MLTNDLGSNSRPSWVAKFAHSKTLEYTLTLIGCTPQLHQCDQGTLPNKAAFLACLPQPCNQGTHQGQMCRKETTNLTRKADL